MIKLSELIKEAYQIQRERELLRNIKDTFKDVDSQARITPAHLPQFPGDRGVTGFVAIDGSIAYQRLAQLIGMIDDKT